VIDTSGDPTMHVTKAIVVARPRYEVYAFWRDFENLPRFMYHLESVRNIDGGRTHWVAKSIAGRTVEWDAELVEDRRNERLAWRTVGAGDDVRHAGAVMFLPHGSQATEVEVDLTYDAPGGKVGATIAKLFGQEPGQQVQEDLERFKHIVETGDTGQPGILVDSADMPAKQESIESMGSDRES
jgi:uncharacterized membrane protein